jgi:hypothetical protein
LRLHFAQYLALEVSGTYHQNSYEGGDIKVTQYPVQVSGLVYPVPNAIAGLYFGGGVGWHYTRVDYSGGLAAFSSETKHPFGEHALVGIDLRLGKRFTIKRRLPLHLACKRPGPRSPTATSITGRPRSGRTSTF